MKIVTKRKQKEIDDMTIKKLRFVARATLQNFSGNGIISSPENIKVAENCAEQVFYADDVI